MNENKIVQIVLNNLIEIQNINHLYSNIFKYYPSFSYDLGIKTRIFKDEIGN